MFTMAKTDRLQRKKQKVVVVGLSKTGTSTLKMMLTTLGYSVCGPRKALIASARSNDWAKIDEVLDSYDAFEDWPWPLTYRHVAERFGDNSRFILTTRMSPERWFNSLVEHGRRSNPLRGMHSTYGYYRPDGHEAILRCVYESHNEKVREFFADRPSQLLEFCLEAGDGWSKICSFLDVPDLHIPVPKENGRDAHPNHINRLINNMIAPAYIKFCGMPSRKP